MAEFLKNIRVGAFALTLILILIGCGKDKYTTPISDLQYVGPKPKNLKVDVSPSNTHIQYFQFKLAMSDPNQSTKPKDHWTIEGCRGYFTVDSSAQFTEPLPQVDDRNPFPVATTYPTKYPITLITKEWIERNATYLKGSSSVVPITAHLQFYAHRNSDNFRVVIPVEFTFTIGDF